PPQDITFEKKARKVVLNEEAQLTITDENGETRSTFLAECAPETIMAVLWNVMPELKRTMMTYRKKVGTRVNFFKKLKTELKSIARTITGKEENQSSPEEQVIEVEGNSTNDENKS
ncbi:MAG: hypothetical protein OEZ40_03315, partial [Candidatus Bathyarchaeota archaeon]|nr:hypothetical protein [Candidatus Bathyarchaeota archaeon]